MSFVNFTKLGETELMEILSARNETSIRGKMINDQVIAPEEHLRFCASLRERQDCLYLRVGLDERFIGVVDFQDINDQDHSYEPGGYCVLPPGSDDDIWKYVCAASTFVCLERKLYFPRIRVRKDNFQALIFNTMKLGCKLVSEDSLYYHLTNDWLDPSVRDETGAREELSYLHDLFLLEFDL